MNDKATTSFFGACFVIGLAALSVVLWNKYNPPQLDPGYLAFQADTDNRLAIRKKRLAYEAACIHDERLLDIQFGKVVYDCGKISKQVYPMPDV
jgi:hypothetical protein